MDIHGVMGKGIALVTLMVLVWGGFLMTLHSGMEMSDGHMTDCPFSPGVSLCMMTPLDHADAAHAFFNVVPSMVGTMILLLVAAAIIARVVLQLYLERIRAPLRFFIWREHSPPILALQEAFSNGILNPKVF